MAARVLRRWAVCARSPDRGRRRGAGVLSAPATDPQGLSITRLTTRAPFPFDFVGTAVSHGWVELAPNRWDDEAVGLERTERLPGGRVVHLLVRGRGTPARPRIAIDVRHVGALDGAEKSLMRGSVRRMFRLDEDLEPFRRLCERAGGRWEGVTRGLGRLLRSPTVFEDAVKTMCTTNVQWGGTRAMVTGLVESLGEPGPASHELRSRAFPTPEAIAGADDQTLGRARLGYRAPFVRLLAVRVASGELDLESLTDPGIPADEVHARLLAIKGFGPYAAATMLMLLGRYDRLAVDSVYRAFVTERYFPDRDPSPRELESVYDMWGSWKYLAYWIDLWQGTQEDT